MGIIFLTGDGPDPVNLTSVILTQLRIVPLNGPLTFVKRYKDMKCYISARYSYFQGYMFIGIVHPSAV